MSLGRGIATVYFAANILLFAQNPGPPPPPPGPGNLRSLKTVPLPQFTNSEKYIKDQSALVVLGKAFFWDMQTGSDGRLACASCHFHAGADHRIQNQISNSVAAFSVNQTLTSDDFPFHLLSNPNDNRSAVVRDRADVVGSQGLFRRVFVDIVSGSAAEAGLDAADRPAFSLGGVNMRQVTSRNAPTVINAVFNYRNFWDGRASNIFSGFTPFGSSDPGMNSLINNDGQLTPELVRVENSSLASQAVGPAANDLEMSYSGRTWPKIGKKMLSLAPLAKQRVAPDDSVLGPLANAAGPGLLQQYTYRTLVQNAFQPAYWNSDQLVDAGGNLLAGRKAPAANTNEFTQAEFNFAVFWGLAIQAYEATLVSGDSRFDQFSEGSSGALTAQEQTGLNIFRRSDCDGCHTGAEFTAASLSSVARLGATLQRGRGGQEGLDTGFFRTGVRPAVEDIALGGIDIFGTPFSIALQQSANQAPPVNGVFKTPTLRNAEFTGPYFHQGGQATLEQVIDFYARGSDFPAGGTGPGIRPLNLRPDDRAALAAFLRSLSDDRVRFERAPFDHPELCVPIGSDIASSDPRFPLSAADKWAGIPSVGANGNAVPLQTFDELLQGIGLDGSRAHTLADACAVP
jgi:cytochrome c peroxidase